MNLDDAYYCFQSCDTATHLSFNHSILPNLLQLPLNIPSTITCNYFLSSHRHPRQINNFTTNCNFPSTLVHVYNALTYLFNYSQSSRDTYSIFFTNSIPQLTLHIGWSTSNPSTFSSYYFQSSQDTFINFFQNPYIVDSTTNCNNRQRQLTAIFSS